MKSATELAPRATNFATKKNTSHCNQPLGVPRLPTSVKEIWLEAFRGPEIYRLNLDREQNTTVIRLETQPRRLQFQRHPAEMFSTMAHHNPLPKQTQAKSFLDTVMTTTHSQDMNHQLANPLETSTQTLTFQTVPHQLTHTSAAWLQAYPAIQNEMCKGKERDWIFIWRPSHATFTAHSIFKSTNRHSSQRAVLARARVFFLAVIVVALLAHQISFMSFIGGTMTCCLAFPLTRCYMRFLRNTLMSRRHISLVQGCQDDPCCTTAWKVNGNEFLKSISRKWNVHAGRFRRMNSIEMIMVEIGNPTNNSILQNFEVKAIFILIHPPGSIEYSGYNPFLKAAFEDKVTADSPCSSILWLYFNLP